MSQAMNTGCRKTPQTCTPRAVSRSGFLGSRIWAVGQMPDHREEQRRRAASVPTAALPVHGGEKPVTDQQRWIDRNAAKARRALADPSVRAALLALLGGDDRSRRRERRIAAVRLELAGLEVRWPLLEEDERKP